MGTASIMLRMDADLKIAVEQIFDDLGLSLNAGLLMYVKAIARNRKIPEEVTCLPNDPLYNPAYQNKLLKSYAQADNGELIYKSIDELESMADDE